MKTRDRCDDHSSKKSWVVCNIWFKVRFSDVVVKRDQSGSFLFFPPLLSLDCLITDHQKTRQKPISKPQLSFCQKYLDYLVLCLVVSLKVCIQHVEKNVGNFPISWINSIDIRCVLFSHSSAARCTTFYSPWHFLCRFKFSSHIDFDCFTFTGSTINIL